jgi:RHS repeat-associated protein
VTDVSGEVYQHIEYFAFGETFVEERSNPNEIIYKFNAKELDDETGLYYYGARYYDARISIWYGVDPLAEKYAGISPYAYVANNPIIYIDPDGKEIVNPRKMVLSNRTLIKKLKEFDRAVSRISGKEVSSYSFIISGGDRYIKDGKIFSATNHEEIKKSARKSEHLQEEGATGVDLKFAAGITYDVIEKAAKEVGFRLDPSGKYDDHFHLDLKGNEILMEYNSNDYIPTNNDFKHAPRTLSEKLERFNQKLQNFNKKLERWNTKMEEKDRKRELNAQKNGKIIENQEF